MPSSQPIGFMGRPKDRRRAKKANERASSLDNEMKVLAAQYGLECDFGNGDDSGGFPVVETKARKEKKMPRSIGVKGKEKNSKVQEESSDDDEDQVDDVPQQKADELSPTDDCSIESGGDSSLSDEDEDEDEAFITVPPAVEDMLHSLGQDSIYPPPPTGSTQAQLISWLNGVGLVLRATSLIRNDLEGCSWCIKMLFRCLQQMRPHYQGLILTLINDIHAPLREIHSSLSGNSSSLSAESRLEVVIHCDKLLALLYHYAVTNAISGTTVSRPAEYLCCMEALMYLKTDVGSHMSDFLRTRLSKRGREEVLDNWEVDPQVLQAYVDGGEGGSEDGQDSGGDTISFPPWARCTRAKVKKHLCAVERNRRVAGRFEDNELMALWQARTSETVLLVYATRLTCGDEFDLWAETRPLASAEGQSHGNTQAKKRKKRKKRHGSGSGATRDSGAGSAPPPCPPIIEKWRDCVRDWACHVYAYATPNTRALRELVRLGADEGIVEIGAGSGYWAGLLRDEGGHVAALDVAPPSEENPNEYHGSLPTFTQVDEGTPKDLLEHKGKALFLCYPPPYGTMAVECLRFYRGSTIAYVGETCGDTGTPEFHQQLVADFELTKLLQLPNFANTAYHLSIWKRKDRLPKQDSSETEGKKGERKESLQWLACHTCGGAADASAKFKLRRCVYTRAAVFCSEVCARQSSSWHQDQLAMRFMFFQRQLDFKNPRDFNLVRLKP